VVPKISKLDGEFIDSIREAREIDCHENTIEVVSDFKEMAAF